MLVLFRAVVLTLSPWFPLINHLPGQCGEEKSAWWYSSKQDVLPGRRGRAEMGLFSKTFLGWAVLSSHICASSNRDSTPSSLNGVTFRNQVYTPVHFPPEGRAASGHSPQGRMCSNSGRQAGMACCLPTRLLQPCFCVLTAQDKAKCKVCL